MDHFEDLSARACLFKANIRLTGIIASHCTLHISATCRTSTEEGELRTDSLPQGAIVAEAGVHPWDWEPVALIMIEI